MKNIWQQAKCLQQELVDIRRTLHKYPETGWTEFKTASMVIEKLRAWSYDVAYGDAVIDAPSMMGVPDEVVLAEYMQRAVNEGADEKLVNDMTGGKTGVVAVLRGAKPGKTVAFRFDMDSNDAQEADDALHRPCGENFSSCHNNAMHACGHDGHVAIGLGLAKLLSDNREMLAGTVKLIFQPAEEGVRGAFAMVNKGVVDDVDYFFSGHIGFQATENDMLICSTDGFLATTKIDAVYKGVGSHAGLAPELGKNALLAAAQASISLNTIARHGKGASRINVGVLNAGTGRNVVPDIARLKLETRGETTEINDYMVQEAERILKVCAVMYDVDVSVKTVGSAPSCVVDKALAAEVFEIAAASRVYDKILDCRSIGCSEDCAYFMQRVQQNGGRALFMMYGSKMPAVHHNGYFDFDESCLWKAAGMLTVLAANYTNK